MTNFCECTLTITGPNRHAVLDRVKGEPWNGEPVYFNPDKMNPCPDGLGDESQEWGWRKVYPDHQQHWQEADADVIWFYTPSNPPLCLITALSAMFPQNTFFLMDKKEDLPKGARLFRAGKNSHYFSLSNYNSITGKTATLYEVFCAVLSRTGSVAEALTEVAQEKSSRMLDGTLKPEIPPSQDPDHDAVLDAEIRSLLAPYGYDIRQIPAEEALIAKQVVSMADMNEAELKDRGESLCAVHYL